MHPQDFTTLLKRANTGEPQPFLHFETSSTSTLDTGLLNCFVDEQGRADCTFGDAVFSGQGQYGEFVLSDDIGTLPRRERHRYSAPMNSWSCAMFPNITQAFRYSHLPPANRTYLLEKNVDINVNTSAAVTSFISTCLSSWCLDFGDCVTSSCTVDSLQVGDTMLSAADLDTCLDHLCGLPLSVSSNPDIGGIGVIASYYIQFGLVMTGLLSLILCSSALNWTRLPTADSDELDPPRFVLETVKETVIMVFDKFQRVQCSFAISINVTSLITLQLNAATLSFINRRAMVSASASRTLPTTLVLAALMACNKPQLAMATMIALMWWKFRSARMLAVFRAMWPWSIKHDRSAPFRSTSLQGRCVLFPIVAITGVAYVYFLVYVTQIVNARNWVVDWSFGQIVAISGWLPTVLILLNKCIHGSRQAHTVRLPETLQVIKTESLA
jgi:hypothetical protein